jgi:hypothetical protein
LTDSPAPARRPKPAPRPPEPEPESRPSGAEPAPNPAAPNPTASNPTASKSAAPDAATPCAGTPNPVPSRSARRRAQRRNDGDRQRRLRLVMIAGVAVAVLAGAASIVVALTSGNGSKGAAPSPAPSSLAAGSGARLVDPNAATAFMAAASSDIAAVTSYDYRHLDDALSAGLGVTTGEYRQAYRSALTGELAATAKADRVVHEFQVLDTGIGEFSDGGRRAKVLIFGRQVVTDRSTPAGGKTALLTLCATMERQGSRYLISNLEQDANAGLPPGSPELSAAGEAARAGVVNVLTYSRANFDADLRRALTAAVDPLRTELRQSAAATRSALTKGRYDLTGVVTAIAVKNAAAHAVTLLVAAESSRLSGTGGAASVSQVRYEVTVTDTGGSWAASRISTLTAG